MPLSAIGRQCCRPRSVSRSRICRGHDFGRLGRTGQRNQDLSVLWQSKGDQAGTRTSLVSICVKLTLRLAGRIAVSTSPLSRQSTSSRLICGRSSHCHRRSTRSDRHGSEHSHGRDASSHLGRPHCCLSSLSSTFQNSAKGL